MVVRREPYNPASLGKMLQDERRGNEEEASGENTLGMFDGWHLRVKLATDSSSIYPSPGLLFQSIV